MRSRRCRHGIRAGWRPMSEFCPYVARLQTQGVTDRQESEEPAGIIVEKPLASLARALHAPLIRCIFMKAKERVFEHGVHQGRLRRHRRQFDPRVEERLRH